LESQDSFVLQKSLNTFLVQAQISCQASFWRQTKRERASETCPHVFALSCALHFVVAFFLRFLKSQEDMEHNQNQNRMQNGFLRPPPRTVSGRMNANRGNSIRNPLEEFKNLSLDEMRNSFPQDTQTRRNSNFPSTERVRLPPINTSRSNLHYRISSPVLSNGSIQSSARSIDSARSMESIESATSAESRESNETEELFSIPASFILLLGGNAFSRIFFENLRGVSGLLFPDNEEYLLDSARSDESMTYEELLRLDENNVPR
jgi:hypothetical protein